MENSKMVNIKKGKTNNSINIEDLELFTEEKNIQSVIDVLDLMLNTPQYMNLDFADIIHMANINKTYSINYTKIKKSEFKINEKQFHSKNGIIWISAMRTTTLDMINEFVNIIKQNFDDEANIIYGVALPNELSEIEAEIIELH